MGGYRALDRVEECVGLFLVDVIHNNYTYAHVRKIFSVYLCKLMVNISATIFIGLNFTDTRST